MTDVAMGSRRIVAVTVLALVGSAGCARRCPDATTANVQAPDAPPRPAFDPAAPLCDAFFAREAPRATPCRLVGVYALNIQTNKFVEVQDAWPAVFREGVGWVLLESLWYPEKRPSLETSALRGQSRRGLRAPPPFGALAGAAELRALAVHRAGLRDPRPRRLDRSKLDALMYEIGLDPALNGAYMHARRNR